MRSNKSYKGSTTASICSIIGLCILFILSEFLFKTNLFRGNNKKNDLIDYSTLTIIATLTILSITYSINKDREILNAIKTVKDNTNNQLKKTQNEIKSKVKKIVRFSLGLFFLILLLSVVNGCITGSKIRSVMMFFFFSVITLCNLSYVYERFLVYKNDKNENNDTNSIINFKDFFTKGRNVHYKKTEKETEKSKKQPNKPYINAVKSILPGLVFGVVFGFIDNAGLISGLDALDEPFSKISTLMTGDKMVGGKSLNQTTQYNNERLGSITAGLGNLFSDGLGVTIGAFLGKFAGSLFPQDVEQPIWVDMAGISLGCILGIIIPISFKNLTTGEITKSKKRLIKDSIVILFTLTIIISVLVVLPKQAGENLSKEEEN